MQISTKDWKNYISRLSALNNKASSLMSEWVAKNGFSDTEALIDFAYAIVTKYGEGSAELTCQMYDAIAEMEGKILPAAVPAQTATYDETAKAVKGCLKRSPSGALVASTSARLVKQVGADTMIHNALRDGAEFAWIPSGDTCPFCLMLASNGWRRASKKAIKKGHAEHIHSNCDCQYCVRFSSDTTVAGYDPDKYLSMYDSYEGSWNDKVNAMRREQYALNKDKINAQKRAAYAARNNKLSEGLAQNKKDHKIEITDVAVNKVKAIRISGYTENELLKIQDMNKEILRNARENNNNEVAMFLDKNWKISKPVLGNEHGVEILKDTDAQIALSTSPFRSIVLSHNHPSLSYFSADDIGIFISYPSISTMEVVTNAGKTWHITKTSKYDDMEIMKLYKTIVKNNKGQPLDKIVDDFLSQTYNSIERNR